LPNERLYSAWGPGYGLSVTRGHGFELSSALTRELLGWQPVQPGLIDDLDKGHYFR
jgi:hypothetical protein